MVVTSTSRFGRKALVLCHFSCIRCPGRFLQRHGPQTFDFMYQSKRFPHRQTSWYPQIENQEAARSAALVLSVEGRQLLMQELRKLEEVSDRSQGKPLPVSGSQLKEVFLFHGIPFIGFGILDNLIMIIAGEYIDVKLGAVLGISTMAAAALGNLVSDVAGVGAGGYVEMLAEKIGVRAPGLTPEQANMWQTRWTVGLGRAFGVSLGCLIGMFPLLFYDHEDEDLCEKARSHSTATQT